MKTGSPLKDLEEVAEGSDLQLQQALSSSTNIKDKLEKSLKQSLSPSKTKSEKKHLGLPSRLAA